MTEDLHVDYYQENQQLKAENARLRAALEKIATDDWAHGGRAMMGNDSSLDANVRQFYKGYNAGIRSQFKITQKISAAALATPAESAGPSDSQMLDWLGQSNSIMPVDASDIVNGYRWRGKYCGSIRDAIRAAMKAEGR